VDCGKTFQGWFAGICNECAAKRERLEQSREEEAQRLRAKEAERQRITQAGISGYWYPRGTFEASDTGLHPEALSIARDYAERFTLQSPSLLFFGSNYGVGKTHLAMCIANYALRERGVVVVVKKARDLLLELRNLFSDKTEQTEKTYLDYILSVPLLVLDDVGRDRPTEWTDGVYWTIFDRRMENQLPMIITTNRSLREPANQADDIGLWIGEGARSRLLRMTEGRVIELAGDDLR